MTIDSDLLGPLNVEPEELYSFPQGLFGFPECRRFLLVGAERPGLFWLQSADYPALTFLAVDPFQYFEGYALDLAAPDLRDLEVEGTSDVLVLAVVTLPTDGEGAPTANLQGPIAFNVRSRIAKQVVLEHSSFGTRCPFQIDPPEASEPA